MWDEPEDDGTVVAVRNGTSLAREAPEEAWMRCDAAALPDSMSRWARVDRPRQTMLTWVQLRRRGRIRLVSPVGDQGVSVGQPACGTCGHHTSGVLAGKCTAFVALDDGPPWARMCQCMCVQDPVVRAWLEQS